MVLVPTPTPKSTPTLTLNPFTPQFVFAKPTTMTSVPEMSSEGLFQLFELYLFFITILERTETPTPPETPKKAQQTTEKSPTSVAKNLASEFERIFEKSAPKACVEENLPEMETLTIEYDGRDVLDLGKNVGWNWNYRPSRNVVAEPNFFKFSETNGRYTVVRKMRDKDGRYYYFYPEEDF
ncbi:uncharacterized protein LOC103312956 isoform X1 [Tribolium castaneum]|uniref:uncharacterized protein LOC103312956 isoform X1 n=1 Tax=Tribolium castaneum TaxID=7070 RepID=UPI0030FE3115